jgi:hypothetical protein
MAHEPLSPELALVDPELGARARAALPDLVPDRLAPRAPRQPTAAPAAEPAPVGQRPYPLWARATAALWLLVLGILIGGAAVPHAQDRPRVVPPNEDAPSAICPVPETPTQPPVRPGT